MPVTVARRGRPPIQEQEPAMTETTRPDGAHEAHVAPDAPLTDDQADAGPLALEYDETEVSIADAPVGMLRDAKARRAALRELGGWENAAIIERTVSVNRSREDLYRFWRDFENLPAVLESVLLVRTLDEERSHWEIAGPGGETLGWDARLIADDPGELIAWQSESGADVRNAGWISFDESPVGRGVTVTAFILHDMPGGVVGKALAAAAGAEPGVMARRDMRRFKQFMETGEVPTAAFRTPEGLVAAPRGEG
jgi:uncharacterized membrane protein